MSARAARARKRQPRREEAGLAAARQASRTRTPGRAELASLRTAAEAALARAYAPYSGLHVAAAVLDANGRIHLGVNVENASFGLTVCAERNALAAALCEGERPFSTLVLVSTHSDPIMPCGACRQVLHELAPDARIRSYGRRGGVLASSSAALLPRAFGAGDVPARAQSTARKTHTTGRARRRST